MALLPQTLPVASQPQRKASITTGVGKDIEHCNNCFISNKNGTIFAHMSHSWEKRKNLVLFETTLSLNT